MQDHGIIVPVRLPTKEAVGEWLPVEVPNCLLDGTALPASVVGGHRVRNFEGFNMERLVCCLLNLPHASSNDHTLVPMTRPSCDIFWPGLLPAPSGTPHPHMSIEQGA